MPENFYFHSPLPELTLESGETKTLEYSLADPENFSNLADPESERAKRQYLPTFEGNSLALAFKDGEQEAGEQLILGCEDMIKNSIDTYLEPLNKKQDKDLYDDLLQEGKIAVLEAALTFNPDKYERFTQYAHKKVKHEIASALGLFSTPTLPSRRIHSIKKIAQEQNNIPQYLTKNPEIFAQQLDIPLDTFKFYQLLNSYLYPVSLDEIKEAESVSTNQTVSIEGQSIVDNQFDREKFINEEFVREILNLLTERDQLVLELRYGLNPEKRVGMENPKAMTYQEIAILMKISAQGVRHLELTALDNIRVALSKHPKSVFKMLRLKLHYR